MGITDVDDKILKRAAELHVTPLQVAQANEREFFASMRALGVRAPLRRTRVTEHIAEIVHFTQCVVDAGLAYRVSDGVYFDTREYAKRFGAYHLLGGVAADDAAVEEEDASQSKRCKADFALWKVRDAEAVGWASPFGHGRPGWHIECSAMIESAFGAATRLDVHSGGVDLCFPHHNNEMAQTVARRGGAAGDWFGHFVHVGHLHIEGRKMSKSLKNFITVGEMLAQWPSDVFRMFVVMHHYRAGTNFSPEKMDDARAVLTKLVRFAELRVADDDDSAVRSLRWDRADEALSRALDACERDVAALLANDLQTHEALHRWMALASEAHKYVSTAAAPKDGLVARATAGVQRFLSACGFESHLRSGSASAEQAGAVADAAVAIRERLKQLGKQMPAGELRAQCFAASDWARDEALARAGVEVNDSAKGGTTWRWKQ